MNPPLVALPVEEVAEWKTVLLPDRQFAPADRRLAASMAGTTDRRLEIDELKTGLRISARSWIGVVRFSTFELRVLPKLVGHQLDLVRMVDFATGLDCLDRHPGVRKVASGELGLLDLIVLLLSEACERILKGGPLADYREVEDSLPVVRGRILIREQVLRRFGQVDRVICRHDERTTDVPDNQLLLAALSICFPRVTHPSVSLRVRRMHDMFSQICSLDGCDLRELKSGITYDRMNGHYRDAHALACLVLDGFGVDDLLRDGRHRCFSFMLDMNRLFEDFVTRWLGAALPGSEFRVLPQRRDRTILWDAEADRPYTSIIPDLVVESFACPGRLLPVDAKYKLYDEKSIASSDIFQSFLYGFAYGREHHSLPTALLLYPASSPNPGRLRLIVKRSGDSTTAELKAIGIHIPTALREAAAGYSGAICTEVRDILHHVLAPFEKPA